MKKHPVLHRFLKRKVSVAAACVLLLIVLVQILQTLGSRLAVYCDKRLKK